MGIDAEMFVRVRRPVPDDEVRLLRMRLGDAFGSSMFYINRGDDGATGEADLDEPETYVMGRRSHSIVRVREIEGQVPVPGESYLLVNLATRFYGVEYERGDLPFILSLARFLRDATGGEVWYGGDSGGAFIRVLDDAYERELWDHFVKHGHRPYRSDFGGTGIPRPHCAMCGNAPMRFAGTGRNGMWTVAVCDGCGASVETDDGGATWTVRKEQP